MGFLITRLHHFTIALLYLPFMSATSFIKAKLDERASNGLLRQLHPPTSLVDFSSNDYLGFAQDENLHQLATQAAMLEPKKLNGATGSRLISGNSITIEETEKFISKFHEAESALIFNSGYDANLGLLSALPQKGDTIITDELVHASIIDGARLSHANRYKFAHNNCADLEQKLKIAKGIIYVVVESIYSMDGDLAPLQEIASLCQTYKANLIVDEAHALGIFGKFGCGLVQHLNLTNATFARVVTFGKALGCHGAAVLGSSALRSYLINFSRSFIYTTALPPFQIALIRAGYQSITETNATNQIQKKIAHFKANATRLNLAISTNPSAIQYLLVGNGQKAKEISHTLAQNGYYVRPILSPTVAHGTERLRICLHTFNSNKQIEDLLTLIAKIF